MGFEKGKVIIDRKLLLSRVSELDIFEAFCPTRFVINRAFSSPFRKDKNPSCVIHFKNGYYYFADYGDLTYRGDCFDFVKFLVPGLKDFPDILLEIDGRMGLKLTTAKWTEVSVRKKIEEEDEEVVEEYKNIQCKIRKFSRDAIAYWNEYHLDISDLKRDKDVQTYMIDRFWIDKKLFYINHNDLCFGHLFKGKHWKLYRPNANVDKGEWKWLSNVPLKEMWGLDNLKADKPGIGAKSVKDYYVMRKIKEEICGTQNESLAAISEENATFIKENTSDFYVFFDADAAGKKASYAVTGEYEYKHLNTPDYLLRFGVNDPAGWSKRDSPEAVQYHLKCKNIL